MLQERISVIDAERLKTVQHLQIERSGIVSRIDVDGVSKIQFYCLCMQEFLASIQYLKTVTNRREFFSKNKLAGSFPFFAGLRGASSVDFKSPQVLISFVRKLSLINAVPKGSCTVVDFAVRNIFWKYFMNTKTV